MHFCSSHKRQLTLPTLSATLPRVSICPHSAAAVWAVWAVPAHIIWVRQQSCNFTQTSNASCCSGVSEKNTEKLWELCPWPCPVGFSYLHTYTQGGLLQPSIADHKESPVHIKLFFLLLPKWWKHNRGYKLQLFGVCSGKNTKGNWTWKATGCIEVRKTVLTVRETSWEQTASRSSWITWSKLIEYGFPPQGTSEWSCWKNSGAGSRLEKLLLTAAFQQP